MANSVQELQLLEGTLTERFREENEKMMAKYEEEYLEKESQAVNKAVTEAEVDFRSREER